MQQADDIAKAAHHKVEIGHSNILKGLAALNQRQEGADFSSAFPTLVRSLRSCLKEVREDVDLVETDLNVEKRDRGLKRHSSRRRSSKKKRIHSRASPRMRFKTWGH